MVSTVQKSYRKNILREMKSSISRVVSLFGIVALGVMMLTGLMCIAPDMRTAAQKYYVQQNVFDLRVLSTLGLSQGDISAIAAVDGVDAVQAVKYQDVEGRWTGNEQTTVARLYQLPADPQADTPENMNRPVLLSGRMPEAAGECVVHVMGHGSPVELGTQLTLPEETEGVSGPAAFFHRFREQHRGRWPAGLHPVCAGGHFDRRLLYGVLYQGKKRRIV